MDPQSQELGGDVCLIDCAAQGITIGPICNAYLSSSTISSFSHVICINLPGLSYKIPETIWLKYQKLIFSLFWRLEVEDWHVGRHVDFIRGLSSWFVDGSLLAISSYDLSCVHLHSCCSACSFFLFL